MQMEAQTVFVNVALDRAFNQTRLSDRDRAFVTALVMGVTRRRAEIDRIIAQFAKQKLEKTPQLLLNVLRLGILQLLEMEDIPSSAVVDTSCHIAQIVGHKGWGKFANGLLRNYLRHAEQKDHKPLELLPKRFEADSRSDVEMAEDYSIPLWMVERWRHHYGVDDAEAILRYAQKRPPLVLRTCTMAISSDGLRDLLLTKGIASDNGKLVADCLIIEPRKSFHRPPQELPGFAEGLFAIQDETSAFASIVLDPKPGEFVVDLCAAPGGKSLHLAELMENRGLVLAVDKSAARLKLLEKSRKILGFRNIQVAVDDSTKLVLKRQADRILVDAPCLGTGVLNRRPDARNHKRPSDLQNLTVLQRQLLSQAASLVRVGGSIVYSTCSIEPEENIENFNWFLDSHKNFKGEDISRFINDKMLLQGYKTASAAEGFLERAKAGSIQFLPSQHNLSGFFVSRVQRVE